jgi:hypothetical protein
MRCRAESHSLVYGHSRQAGMTPGDPHMQRYSRELFLLSRQCGAAGLAKESAELFDLAREASGSGARDRLEFGVYRGMANAFGWTTVGRLSCRFDRLRGSLSGVPK